MPLKDGSIVVADPILRKAVQNALNKSESSGFPGKSFPRKSSLDDPYTVEDFSYRGPFKVTCQLHENGVDWLVKVGSGYINRNGTDYIKTEEKIWCDAETGTLCVVSELDTQKAAWSDPVIKYATPSECAYPIAETKVIRKTTEGKTTVNVSIRQFPVTVAMLMKSKTCPLAKLGA